MPKDVDGRDKPGHDEGRRLGPGSGAHHFVVRCARETRSIVEERAKFTAPRRMLQLPQRLRLDLPDALSRHRELLADFFQGVVGLHADAEAHAGHAFFARGERGQHAGRGLAQIALDRGVDREDRVLVRDEIAEMRVFLAADGSLSSISRLHGHQAKVSLRKQNVAQ